MFLELVMALSLLTSAPPPEGNPYADAPFVSMGALKTAALAAELMDPREARFMFSRAEDYYIDIAVIQRRFAELGDAPPLEDHWRFPERSLINDLLTINRGYRNHLEREVLLSVNPEEVNEAIRETDMLYNLWDLVRDAKCEYYYITVRRGALKKLRERLGEADYYTGALPPWVPVWRFKSVD